MLTSGGGCCLPYLCRLHFYERSCTLSTCKAYGLTTLNPDPWIADIQYWTQQGGEDVSQRHCYTLCNRVNALTGKPSEGLRELDDGSLQKRQRLQKRRLAS